MYMLIILYRNLTKDLIVLKKKQNTHLIERMTLKNKIKTKSVISTISFLRPLIIDYAGVAKCIRDLRNQTLKNVLETPSWTMFV